MKWLKSTGAAISVAFLALLAMFAVASARRQKSSAEKWQQKSVDIESGALLDDLVTAEAASSQAKLHEAKAEAIKKKAEARIDAIGKKDEDVADILNRWRS